MSSETDKELPAIVTKLFNQTKFVETEKTVKLTAHCKKCDKPITGQWKPSRVISNFISHAKVNTRLYLPLSLYLRWNFSNMDKLFLVQL